MSETANFNDKQFKQRALEYAATEESDSQLRGQLLAEFATAPDNESIWQKAYALARQEEDGGENEFSEYKDIPTDSLIELSQRIRGLPDFRLRYKLMAGKAPNGQLWIDVLTGFSSPDIEQGIDTYLSKQLAQRDGQKFGMGVDLGSGTGRVAELLAKYCNLTVGLDASNEMLTIARQRSGDRVDYRAGVVTKLPFPDKSVDIMTAVGLTGALDEYQQVHFFNEVGHSLIEGGLLIDGHWKNNAQEAIIKLSWKNTLADLIVGTVSGKYQVRNRLNGHQMDDLCRRNGLARTKYSYSWLPGMELVVYEKDRKKLAEQLRGHSKSRDS